jgi:hypothetical protein
LLDLDAYLAITLQLTWHEIRLFLAICWRQGIVRSTRFHFWWQLGAITLRKPELLYDYFTALGCGEHVFSFRHQVKASLMQQLALLKAAQVLDKAEAIAA